MSTRAFIICSVALVLAVLLSATPFPGAAVGFLFGVTVAFFVAGPTMVAASFLQSLGVPVTYQHIVIGLLSLYGVTVLAVVGLACNAWRREPPDAARALTLGAAALAALPLIVWLSSRALVAAWH